MRRERDDEGTVLVLVLGLTAVLLVLVGVVVDVSASVLAERSLAGVADGAAVVAAQQLDEATFYAGGVERGVPLSASGVEAAVDRYAHDEVVDQPGLTLVGTVEDGRTAVVTARRRYALPFGGWIGASTVELTATARASAPLLDG